MSIASYIRDDLAVRLKSGRELPAQLTIDSLAGLYNVSFTPVRTAIAELIDEGLLERGPNRRLIVSAAVDPEKDGSVPVPLPEPPRDFYEMIVNDLVQASLKGVSIHLREEVTAEKYDVSRSVIRNVFHRLAGEGILDHIPRRGWRLRAFRQDDLQSYNEARESLELKALKLAFPKLDSNELQRLLGANTLPLTPEESPRVDDSLHAYFIDLCENAHIKDFFSRHRRYYDLLFRWEFYDREAAIETARQHREILTHLLEKNESAARESLSYHILNNHPVLNKIVDQAGHDGNE